MPQLLPSSRRCARLFPGESFGRPNLHAMVGAGSDIDGKDGGYREQGF